MAKAFGIAALGLMAGMAWADAPDTSIRPMPRGGVAQAAPVAAPQAAPQAATAAVPTLRPRPRPMLAANPEPTVVTEIVAAFTGLDRSPRPRPRPLIAQEQPVAVQAATVAPRLGGLFGFLAPRKRPQNGAEPQEASATTRIEPGRDAVVSKKGSVCGVNAIKGETLAPIPAKMQGCGIDEPVRVTSVGGIALSTPATINCTTATALHQWVKQVVEPVYGKGKVVELRVAASYACRPRNNIRGAKVSEHGRGNAIDIAGLTLSNGKTFMVRGDFDKKMRQVHQGACGIFGTTLGPGSDGYHEDHMHFDVAAYRNGAYCR